ncbi:MAG: response regulator transcription factor [Bacteroidia bacterium]|nr:response regulator transcription factor [Bacteroidia bacterium]
MQDLNCLIVEDEPLAAKIIEDYVSQLPGLKLKSICGDVISAGEKLRTEKIDIIFLDINLPKINGLEFAKSINNKYSIIITTAYHQYALEGFNLNVTDYLLKPIEFSRFVQAINKVYTQNSSRENIGNKEIDERKFYFFVADKKRHKIFFDEILYVESLKDYVKVQTGERSVVTKFQIGEMEELLKGQNFFRIHKSFIVNLNHLTAFNANEIEIGKINLPIGRTYAELFKRQMEK